VKKLSGSTTLKLIHEKYTARGPGMVEGERFKEGLRFAMAGNKEVAQHVDKAQEDLSPLRVYELFKNVTDEDAEILWLNPRYTPEGSSMGSRAMKLKANEVLWVLMPMYVLVCCCDVWVGMVVRSTSCCIAS
jgi:hypothetical protein